MQNFPNNIVPTLSLYFIYYTTLIESCQFARAIIDEKVLQFFASKIKEKSNKNRLPNGILSERTQKGLGFSQQAKKGKWVLICCACSLLKTRKGRERNGTETKNQRRAYRCKKSAVSRIADTRNHNAVRQDALSFYR